MKQRTILLAGGGTAGHITPTLHVARALKRSDSGIKVVYVIERKCKFTKLVTDCDAIDEIYEIPAGKYRRFHGTNIFQKILDVKTNFLNFIDIFKTIAGFVASLALFIRVRPDVVFAKGGFVVVPIGYAARLFRVGLVTHDSDTQPGLANKIISKWAIMRTVATESAAVAYGKKRTMVVGIPVSEDFRVVTKDEQYKTKEKLGIDPKKQLIFIIGGSLGSQNLNAAVREMILRVSTQLSDIHITWIVGTNNLKTEESWLTNQANEVSSRVNIRGFVDNVSEWFQAADLIVSRAGATLLAEIIASNKPSIVVPAAFLPGGHQVDNAEYLATHGATRIVREQEDVTVYASELAHFATKLLTDQKAREDMVNAISKLGQSNATNHVADILLGSIHEE